MKWIINTSERKPDLELVEGFRAPLEEGVEKRFSRLSLDLQSGGRWDLPSRISARLLAFTTALSRYVVRHVALLLWWPTPRTARR